VTSILTVQGNLSPGPASPMVEDQSLSIHRQLTLRAVATSDGHAERGPPHSELVIWPESTLRVYLRQEPHFRETVFDLAETLQQPLLLGSLDATDDGQGPFNSLVVVSPARRVTGTYHKTRLLPFGESAPFFGTLWRTTGSYRRGDTPELLEVGAQRFAPSICYEALFPGVFNRLVREGADFLVNITDDSWFGAGNAPWQHLQGAIFRAVETRRPLVRASNSGISAIVEPSGRISARTELFARTVMRGTIAPASGQTIYVRGGDWFAVLCALAAAASIVRAAWHR